MNKYIVIDQEINTIISMNDLKYIVNDEFDRYGSSVSCIDKEDLINEMEKILNDYKEENN